MADPVSLICHRTMPHLTDSGATTIELDEAQRTVTVHFAGYQMAGIVRFFEPRALGPVQGTFTPQTITFQNPDTNTAPSGGPDHYTLNRLTGDLEGEWAQDAMNCQVGAKRF
ncbi:MAG TPA: hypothetical protein VN718_00155 [Rhizomicrobium sp.]|nr:hypothetical protein [Rhizomicrobium sp.]